MKKRYIRLDNSNFIKKGVVIIKIINYWLHFKTITKHKWYVFNACKDCGIVWRGIKHDLSKFSVKEFISSAKYFQGNSSPIDAEKIAKGYSIAWQNHKGHNTHHWQYWLDNNGKEIIPLKMPYKDLIELICDWIGAGKAYNKGKWTQEEPWNYWCKNKDKMLFNQDTYIFINETLRYIKDYGWSNFSYTIKKKNWEY
jgi:hypothetical protein